MTGLLKTLCAMRWIALMNGNYDVALQLERDMDFLECGNRFKLSHK